MKNTFKRTLALALAVVMLLSVSVIGVSAEDTEVALNGGVNTDTVTVYEFWQEKYASDSNFVYNFGATDMTGTISEHYAKGELNWKVAYTSSTTDSCTGKSLFSAGRPYHYVQISKSAGNNFYGLYLKNPGAGTYDVTLNYSVTNDVQAATEMTAYLFPAAFVADQIANNKAVDGQWKYAISNNDTNTVVGSTDANGVVFLGTYSCYDAAVEQYEERSLTVSDVELIDGEAYILVLGAVRCTGTDSTLKHYVNQLALEKTTPSGSVSYDFFARANGTTMYDATAGLADDFAAGTLNWKYENTFGNSVDEEGNVTGYYYHGLNDDGTTYNNGRSTFATAADGIVQWMTANGWLALRVKAPGTGTYNVSLTHATCTRGASAANIYLFDAPATSASVEDIQKLVDGATAAQATTNFCGGIANDSSVVYGDPATSSSFTYTFTADKEYLLVMQAKTASTMVSGFYWMFLSELTAEPIAAEIKNPESTSADFYIADLDGKTISVAAATIKDAYDEGTLNWRYEAASAVYQMSRNNKIYSAVDGIQVYNGVKNAWFAVRVKSPGTGEYNVSVDHATYAEGAQSVSGYLLDASAVDAAINAATGGNNAADYAEQQSADPYQDNTNNVGTYNAYYKTAIESLLTNAASVFTMNCYSAENATSVSTTGTYSFVEGKEYVLVLQVNEISPTASKGHIVFSELNLVPTVSYESAGQYTTLRAAINAAEADAVAGATVTMLADAEVVDLGVTCNIDLNGNDLTVYGDMTSVAAVSDSKDGEGVLTVTGEMILAGTQAQLPLYDAAVNGCRLYSVTWGDNNQSKAAGNNAKKFWFQLYFDNTAAYDLIASGTSGLSIGVVLDWGTDSKAFDFVEGTAAAFAAGWGEFMKTAETPWLWVNVLNVVEGLTVAPVVEANGARITCGAIA